MDRGVHSYVIAGHIVLKLGQIMAMTKKKAYLSWVTTVGSKAFKNGGLN